MVVIMKYAVDVVILVSNQYDGSRIELCRGIKDNVDIANPQQHNMLNK